jgi:NitT/TauT family transport system permease protein
MSLATSIKQSKTTLVLSRVLFPAVLIIVLISIWHLIARYNIIPSYQLPSPGEVVASFREEIISGRLIRDVTASIWRVVVGFMLAAMLAIPIGLALAQFKPIRHAFLPLFNFLRFLSPLSWIPFAILWFHIGDKPAIFLIFMSTFFPMMLSTMVAVANIPSVYFRVASDYSYRGLKLLTHVTFPAVLPQIITALRMSCGIAWIVIVAAEMVGCQDGLGFGIWDARNGLRLDTVVCYMTIIGLLGIVLDRLLEQLTKLPNVRWGYEK